MTLGRLEDRGNALKAYEQAIVIGPDDLLVRINYCLFLFSSQQLDQARYHLGVAEEIAGKTHVVDKEVSNSEYSVELILWRPGEGSLSTGRRKYPIIIL